MLLRRPPPGTGTLARRLTTAPNEGAPAADSTEENTLPLTEQNRPMIVVTRLNGTRFAVNPDLIERIHESPDTHLVTLDGAAYVVLESLAEVVELIAEYRAYILSKARDFPAITGYPLSLVRTEDPDTDPRAAGSRGPGRGAWPHVVPAPPAGQGHRTAPG